MPPETNSPFHEHELKIQTTQNVSEVADKQGRRSIRSVMPKQHQIFFSQLPFVIVSMVDKQGFPWAMPIFGDCGFIHCPDELTIKINVSPFIFDALAIDFVEGKKIGLLGIELSKRRRNRMNGIIKNINDDGFDIKVEQSFGNCPQYIHKRELTCLPDTKSLYNKQAIKNVNINTAMDLQYQHLIEKADTFFIASRTAAFNHHSYTGIDVSHRGGKAGFITIQDNVLSFPDFSGNNFFNTMGNIESDGRVGLFVPDFITGNGVYIIGKSQINSKNASLFYEGAKHIVDVKIEKIVYIEKALPFVTSNTSKDFR